MGVQRAKRAGWRWVGGLEGGVCGREAPTLIYGMGMGARSAPSGRGYGMAGGVCGREAPFCIKGMGMAGGVCGREAPFCMKGVDMAVGGLPAPKCRCCPKFGPPAAPKKCTLGLPAP